MGNGKKGDFSDDIKWGIELADHLGVPYGTDDYWPDEFEDEDEDDGPTLEEQQRESILRRTSALAAPEGAELQEIKDLEGAKDAVHDRLDVDPVGGDDIVQGEILYQRAEDMVRDIGLAISDRAEEHRQIDMDFHALDDKKGEIKLHQTKIAAARLKADEALKQPITTSHNATARQAVEALEKLIDACEQELRDLGGKDGVGQIFSAFNITGDELAQLDQAFGSRKAFLDAMKAFGGPHELAVFCGKFGQGMKGAKAAADLANALGGPGKIQETAKSMGGVDKLAALQTKGALDPSQIAKLCTEMGPAFIGEMMGASSDPTSVIDLQKEFGAKITDFTDLVKDAGFDAKPKALVALFEQGCKGKADEFKKLCASFSKPAEREALKGVIEKGGLGDSPNALAALFSDGCGGDPETLKTFALAFDDDTKRDGLNQLLDKGGLKGDDPAIAPGVLGAMFKNISGDKPSGESDADFAKTRASKLADLAKGLGADDCDNLKSMLVKGGLGADPEVFSHLVGMGCGNGDLGKVQGLAKALAADATGLERLDDLLKKGGFGTKDDAKADTGTDPKCLAHLFNPGCDGKPDELLKLTKALGDADRKALKGVMTTGELGKNPKIIGKMYQHGCLDDPTGKHDGKKTPQVLIDMVGEFADKDGPALFKNMMSGSGFTEDGKEDRLASVLRHAFTPKHSAPKKQSAKSLRKLANSFNGHFGDLKTTMEAMEAAPDHILERNDTNEPNQPGKGLGNLIHADKYKGDPSNLRAQLFVPLKTRASAPAAGTEAGWSSPPSPPKMTDVKDLLMTAASFEHRPITNATVQVGAQNYDFDMDHAAGRHSRKHGKFHLNSAPHMGTTLFHRDVTEDDIKDSVSKGIAPANITRQGPNPGNRTVAPFVQRRTPPIDQHDFTGNFMRTNGDDNGEVSRIGFLNDGGTAKITQYYPIASARALQHVNNNDFITMNNVLNTAQKPLY